MREVLTNIAKYAVCGAIKATAFSIQARFEKGTRLLSANNLHRPEGVPPGLPGYDFDADTSTLTVRDGYGREVKMLSADGSGYDMRVMETLPSTIPLPPSAEIYAGRMRHILTKGKQKIEFETRDGKQRRVSVLWTPPEAS